MSKLKSRSLMKKSKLEKGMYSLNVYLGTIQSGSKVVIRPCKDYKRNVPNRRFVGKVGSILEVTQKNNYKVLVDKKILNLPKAHIKKWNP